MKKETIAAISTGMSNSGIGIVRISGEEAFEIADRIFRGKRKLSQCKTSLSWSCGRLILLQEKIR